MNRFFLAAFLFLAACNSQPAAAPPLQGARIGAPFQLTNQDGAAVTDRDFAGRYRIMYFGYTFCPDVCPVDVQILGAGLKAFETRNAEKAKLVVPIFVTVDPARDTAPVVKQFVSAFHPRMVGLTGGVPAITALAKAYGVYFKLNSPAAGGGYLVDHSRQAYLMGKQGEPIALLPTEKGAEAVADELQRWVQ